MNKLGIDSKKYDAFNDIKDKISFVLINPSNDLQLQSGDIIYLLKPGCKFSKHNQNDLLNVLKMNENKIKISEAVNDNGIKLKKKNRYFNKNRSFSYSSESDVKDFFLVDKTLIQKKESLKKDYQIEKSENNIKL
jgi:hypothetical protein